MTDFLYGYDLIRWIQSFHNGFLDYFFFTITELGTKYFYIAAIAFLYWCVDKKFGVRVFYLFIVGILANQAIKDYFGLIRPDPAKVRVVLKYYSDGYSFPSGHTQGALAFWGYCFTRFKNILFILFGLFMIVVMPLSRLYLGVHFPIDVIGGIVLGLATIIFFLTAFKAVERYGLCGNMILNLLLLTFVPLIVFFAFPSQKLGQFMGVIIGFGAGSCLETKFIDFKEEGGFLFQTVKLAAGFITVTLILYLFSLLHLNKNFGDLLGCAAGGFWVGFGFPYLFSRVK